MKKIFLILISLLCFTGYSGDREDFAYEIVALKEMVSNLTVRVTQLEHRRMLTAATKEKAKANSRAKSRLVMSSETRESMNLLGERFPKGSIKLNKLPDLPATKKKPYMATPKVAPYTPPSTEEVQK